MVLVYLSNGDCLKFLAGVSVINNGDKLRVLGEAGERLAVFPVASVELYTGDAETAAVIEQNVCDDLTVIREQP